MKRLLILILSVLIILPVFSSFEISTMAKMPSSNVLDGYENLCLTYTFRYGAAQNGAHNADDLLPYVAYLDKNGTPKDYFFDSYLFLTCVTYGPSGARIHVDTSNPTLAIDWTTYVKDTFKANYNVDALEVAMGKANAALGGNKKAGVYFSILYPCKNATSFGTLGGKSLNFSKQEDRKYAIKWIIDEQLKLYNQSNYKNLDLVGFYWLEEFILENMDIDEEIEIFQYASDYLHSLGLKFIWIPWYCANGYGRWEELGFDAACMQPNMYWQSVASKGRVETSISLSKNRGMGMEVEIDGNALTSAEYFNRYLDYLDCGMRMGAMDSIKTYYQDGKPGVYYRACYSTNDRARAVYDLTYKYAKKILKKSDIEFYRAESFSLPKGVEWVSKGKKYTAAPSFVDGNGADYQNVNGKELTDGILAKAELSTDWHAFHHTAVGSDGRHTVVVDLGKVYTDLTNFMAHFDNCRNHGIGYPTDIKFYVSNDGVNYTFLCNPELEFTDNISYVRYLSVPVSARYVKLSFAPDGASAFVFMSEVLVGIDNGKGEPLEDETPSQGDNGNGGSSSGNTTTNPSAKPDKGDESSKNDETTENNESTSQTTSNLDESTVNNSQTAEDDESATTSAEDISSDTAEGNNGDGLLWIWISLGAVVLLAIVAFIVIKAKK